LANSVAALQKGVRTPSMIATRLPGRLLRAMLASVGFDTLHYDAPR
jgi:hypothetical protein